MCGIFFVYGSPNVSACLEGCMTLQQRGPDQTTIMFDKDTFMGFQRLKINDLTDAGNQPMYDNSIDESFLLCNGEIYNCKELNKKYRLSCMSESDCETVMKLYSHMTYCSRDVDDILDDLPNSLDGEFAFVIHNKESEIIACRDPYGVRPLFYYMTNVGTRDFQVGFASELKALQKVAPDASLIKQFPPGTIMRIELYIESYRQRCDQVVTTHTYAKLPIPYSVGTNEEDVLPLIRDSFTEAVCKRLMSERKVASLLSGGLDSSLVAAIVARHIAPERLETFCIGIKGSTDLHYAKLVAKHIGSSHHSIEVDEEVFLDAIEETIKTIESYDITSVRASVGNLLVSKYIAKYYDCQVIFNGDFSDEVTGGYMYFKNAPTADALHEESTRLLKDICYFDALRSDRTISSQGLEARVPFSDKKFVETYMSIDPQLRMCDDKIEKYLLRKAFENENLLPNEVLWRYKTAFSDGVSSPENSWHKVVQKYIDTKISDEEFHLSKEQYTHNQPQTKEAYYYRKVFEEFYPGMSHVIPYFWLPKWCGTQVDPSARELSVCTEHVS